MKKIFFVLLVSFISLNSFAFNQWDIKKLKESCSCINCDLRGADLSNFILGNKNTFIPGEAKRLNGGIVCDIRNADFTGANLKNAIFSVSDFAPGLYPNVNKVIMHNANFSGANLENAQFNAVNADNTNFTHANLKGTRMMKGTSMRNANFTFANLPQASVRPPMGGCGADFTGSDFSHANLAAATIIANMTNVNFSFANLSASVLEDCNSANTNFTNTNFSHANLTDAKSDQVVITEKILKNAILCHTQFGQSTNNRNCQ